MKIVKTERLGEVVLGFSLENEINANLRNRIRRIIENLGLIYTGTSLYAGQASETALSRAIDQITAIARADVSGSTLTNLEVWFYGNARYSLTYDPVEDPS